MRKREANHPRMRKIQKKKNKSAVQLLPFQFIKYTATKYRIERSLILVKNKSNR